MTYRVFVKYAAGREFVGFFDASDGQDAIRQAEQVHLAPETAIWVAEPEPVRVEAGE